MAYVVTDLCKKDFVCVEQCATAAIAPMESDPQAGTVAHVYINPDEVHRLRELRGGVREPGAIFAEADLPADKAHFVRSRTGRSSTRKRGGEATGCALCKADRSGAERPLLPPNPSGLKVPAPSD